MSRTMAPLTEPTSETIAPGFEMRRDLLRATGPQAPTGMQRMTRSASLTASALVSTTRSTMPSSATRARVFSERAVVTISPASPCARAARAIEPPIRPKPISAMRLNRSASRAHLRRHEVAQALDDEAVGLLGADGHAQRVRQAVIVQRPQHQAAPGEERIGVCRGLAFLGGKWIRTKFATLGVTFRPSFVDLLRQPVAPFLGVRLRHLDMRGVLDRGHRRQHRRRRDVEGPADAVHRVDDVGGAEHPADPQAPPARGSWRRCASSRCSRWSPPVRCPARNRCATRSRNRRRRAPAAPAAAGRRAAA